MKSITVYLALALAAAETAHGYAYCAFYEQRGCKGNHSIGYSVDNDGCFQTGGRYFGCTGTTSEDFHMRQFPNNAQICGTANHCHGFRFRAVDVCYDLKKFGYDLRYSTYLIQRNRNCPNAVADSSTAEAGA